MRQESLLPQRFLAWAKWWAIFGTVSYKHHIINILVDIGHFRRLNFNTVSSGRRRSEHGIPDSATRRRGNVPAATLGHPGARHDKTVLVQLRDATDPETGQRYTVKRYKSEKAKKGDSWRHEKITLQPVNPDFAPIVLTGADEGEFQVIADLVEVLGG